MTTEIKLTKLQTRTLKDYIQYLTDRMKPSINRNIMFQIQAKLKEVE